ncbi:hypothetical protein [Nocardioides bizhenqiangii]|uniref:Uncharacterized protein n=1 Tax=Nocardioides bizhenqiangii TaxID=3095076 RepID=A0ABZ0ZSY1_9ACTN|nr:hypothetical protein [Nocardioides sp. HM61]WQQ27021.1 hypothetical protein SHK19_02040 [Nocardioides sp. HM61]
MKLRPSHAVAAGAAVLGMLVAAPAIAGVGQASDPGRQPSAGASAEKKSDFRVGSQPKAGVEVKAGTTDFRLGKQPVNRNPQKPTKVAKVRDNDRGVKGLKVTKDRGKRNLPATRDRGVR